MEKTAIILAGGLGTRLRTVVQDRPKPMALVHNRPFLAHQLDYWIAEGIERFILSVGYKHEMITDFFGDKYNNAQIEYVIEDSPMGTGGGLLLALNKAVIDGPFLLLNGDTYFPVALEKLITFSENKAADLTFSLFQTTDKNRYMGININDNGQVVALKNVNNDSIKQLASGGVYWVRNTLALKKQFTSLSNPLSLEDDILPKMQENGDKLFGLRCDNNFIDIGLPDDYFRSESILSIKSKSVI